MSVNCFNFQRGFVLLLSFSLSSFFLLAILNSPCFSFNFGKDHHSGSTLRRAKYGDGVENDKSPVIITLAANSSIFHNYVEHNCEMLTRAGYDYQIHTDNLSAPYCRQCSCIPFKPEECVCRRKPHLGMLCNKLKFISKKVVELQEILFLDADILIVSKRFLPALLARTSSFDFLASHNFVSTNRSEYFTSFNSGLMFWRNLPEVNMSKMVDAMHERDTCFDQRVISDFVHKYISRWDTLSLAFHCRSLNRFTIPPSRCLAFHGFGPLFDDFSERTNFTLKKMEIHR